MLEKNEKRITKIAQNPDTEFVGIPYPDFFAENRGCCKRAEVGI